MIYTNLDGTEQESDIWCPGPLFGTAWLVNGAVVKLATAEQVPYDQPMPNVGRTASAELVEYARGVMRDWWQSDGDTREYRLRVGLRVPERPSAEEYELARAVVAQEERRQEAGTVYRQGHTASTPVSITRIRELSDELCSETSSSVE